MSHQLLIKDCSLVTFFNAILELFLKAFGLGHDILLDATLWHG